MVGERLAELREQKALTLHDLEELSGVGADGISKIENGHRKPRPSTLRKLARALGVEVEDFFREPAVPLGKAPGEAGLASADPSAKLVAASALEEIAELWAEQLARGFYDRRTLGLMRFAGVYLSSTIESAAKDYRETLPPHFRTQLEAAEERFADVWAQIWEAREALEEADREHPAPPDELAARREAKREEFLKQMRDGGQARHA
jgi:HTH-type transcriptional regulator, competence development regulator